MQKKSYLCAEIMDEKQNIGSLFDRIATTYDGLNHGLSLNFDRLWRKRAVREMKPAECVLDVAIGTADLTIEMLRQGKEERGVGLDLSAEMMRIGEAKCKDLNLPVEFILGNAQMMPFADESFDGVTCAYGCRNFSDLDAGLREMYRVLKKGGEVTILEFSYPENGFVRSIYNLYFTYILPFIGRVVSRDETAYSYLNKSVKHFCWGEAFAQHLRDAGFCVEYFQPFTLGITTFYRARKRA